MSENNKFGIDVLAIGAHPDDVEMSAGGCIAKLVQEGKRVVIVDCTHGELGTRGTPALRDQEAARAASILGVEKREILSMRDGFIVDSEENVLEIVRVFRHYRPRLVLIPPAFERHPDHEAVHRLCRLAYFKSGLMKLRSFQDGKEQEVFSPAHVFCYFQSFHQEADFYIDVSETHHIKMNSIRAFGSQVYNPDALPGDEPETFISNPEFMQMLESRARYAGASMGVKYAEGFLRVDVLGLPSLSVWLQ